jgi:hypothetical protein
VRLDRLEETGTCTIEVEGNLVNIIKPSWLFP